MCLTQERTQTNMSGIANINSLVIKQTKSNENVIYRVNQRKRRFAIVKLSIKFKFPWAWTQKITKEYIEDSKILKNLCM